MDKAWGLALDTSSSSPIPISHSHPFLPSKQPSSTHTNDRMFPILGFPVNLTRNTNGEDGGDRKITGEVDFFSERNKPSPSHEHNQHVKSNIIKKEIVSTDEKPSTSNIHVNVSFLINFSFLSKFNDKIFLLCTNLNYFFVQIL